MRIELRKGALQLHRGQILRIVSGAGNTLCADSGSVWITEENAARDVVLSAGSCYRLSQAGVAVIEALGDASLTLN